MNIKHGNAQLQISTTNYSVANIPSSADKYAGDALSSYENPSSSGLANFKFLGGGKLNLSTDSEIIAPQFKPEYPFRFYDIKLSAFTISYRTQFNITTTNKVVMKMSYGPLI
jgi:hypothetical protein